MLVSFLSLSIVITWALCFLLADAHIFGVDTVRVTKLQAEMPVNVFCLKEIRSMGIFRIRQKLLRSRYILSLFSCYFCLGIWVAPIGAFLTYSILTVFNYPLFALPESVFSTYHMLALLAVDLLVSTGVYVFNLSITKLEIMLDV